MVMTENNKFEGGELRESGERDVGNVEFGFKGKVHRGGGRERGGGGVRRDRGRS